MKDSCQKWKVELTVRGAYTTGCQLRDCWEKSHNHKEDGSPKRWTVSAGDWPDWPYKAPYFTTELNATDEERMTTARTGWYNFRNGTAERNDCVSFRILQEYDKLRNGMADELAGTEP